MKTSDLLKYFFYFSIVMYGMMAIIIVSIVDRNIRMIQMVMFDWTTAALAVSTVGIFLFSQLIWYFKGLYNKHYVLEQSQNRK